MKTINSELSEALIIYVGWGSSRAPKSDDSRIIERFGPSKGKSLLEALDVIFHDVNSMPIDWSTHTLVSAGQAARDHAHRKYPDLSDEALKALEWKFTFDWR